jgi:cell division protein FtsQ
VRRRSPVRLLAGLVLVLAVLGGGFLALRGSWLVEVREVTVTGLTGPEAPQLERRIADAARGMTTLQVDREALLAAAGTTPVVAGLEVETDLPHGLRVRVLERTPVAMVEAGDQRILVAGDGRLLRGAARRDVPLFPVERAPVGDRVEDPAALRAIRALATAPDLLRRRVGLAYTGDAGLTLDLADGPELRFGDAARLRAKWASAAAVLGSPASRGASYLDLRQPERPAAGGLEDPATQADPGASAAVQPTPDPQPGVEAP